MVDEKIIVKRPACVAVTGGFHQPHAFTVASLLHRGRHGIIIDWKDYAELSSVGCHSMTRINQGEGRDINAFIDCLLYPDHCCISRIVVLRGILHEDVQTVVGRGLSNTPASPSMER